MRVAAVLVVTSPDGGSRCPISYARSSVLAHVLDDNLTVVRLVRYPAPMLCGPFDLEQRRRVVVHGPLHRTGVVAFVGIGRRISIVVRINRATAHAFVPDLVTGGRIVLRIKQPVVVTNVVRDFVQFVVTTAGIVHVQVGVGALVKAVF